MVLEVKVQHQEYGPGSSQGLSPGCADGHPLPLSSQGHPSVCLSYSLYFFMRTHHIGVGSSLTASFLLDQTILHPVPCCNAGAQGFHIKIGGGNTIQPITPRIKYSFYFPQSLYHSQHGLKVFSSKGTLLNPTGCLVSATYFTLVYSFQM